MMDLLHSKESQAFLTLVEAKDQDSTDITTGLQTRMSNSEKVRLSALENTSAFATRLIQEINAKLVIRDNSNHRTVQRNHIASKRVEIL